MASVLMRPPLRANAMRPFCVTPRFAPSPTTSAFILFTIDADAVIGFVADFGVSFGARLDVIADAAEPHEFALTLQQRVHEFNGRH
jgi:hypothetical protein